MVSMETLIVYESVKLQFPIEKKNVQVNNGFNLELLKGYKTSFGIREYSFFFRHFIA